MGVTWYRYICKVLEFIPLSEVCASFQRQIKKTGGHPFDSDPEPQPLDSSPLLATFPHVSFTSHYNVTSRARLQLHIKSSKYDSSRGKDYEELTSLWLWLLFKVRPCERKFRCVFGLNLAGESWTNDGLHYTGESWYDYDKLDLGWVRIEVQFGVDAALVRRDHR